MDYCAIPGCTSNSLVSRKIKFFPFPTPSGTVGNQRKLLKKRRLKWKDAIEREDLTDLKMKHEKVCSRHFVSGSPSRLGDYRHEDWVPSVNLNLLKKHNIVPNIIPPATDGVEHSKKLVTPSKINGTSNQISKQESTLSYDNEMSMDQSVTNNQEVVVRVIPHPSLNYVRKKPTSCDYEIALRNCHDEIYKLRDSIRKYSFSQESMEKDYIRCKYYTALDYKKLMEVHEAISPYLSNRSNNRLNTFQQLVLCLMRLRLEFDFTDLGYRFNVSRRTASNVHFQVLNILKNRNIISLSKAALESLPEEIDHDNNDIPLESLDFVQEIEFDEECVEKPSRNLTISSNEDNTLYEEDQTNVREILLYDEPVSVMANEETFVSSTHDEALTISMKNQSHQPIFLITPDNNIISLPKSESLESLELDSLQAAELLGGYSSLEVQVTDGF